MKKYITQYKNLPVQVRASIWFLICSFMQQGISLLTTPIFTRLLNTAEYGDYNYFYSWMGITTIIISLNLERGVHFQGLIKYENDRDRWSAAIQGLMTTLLIGWLIIYALFSSEWNSIFSLSSIQFIAMFTLIWSSAVFGFWANEQRVDYKYKWLVIITILISLLKPVVSIAFVVSGDDKATARILGITLVQILVYSPLFFIQMKKGKIFYHRQYWKYALAYNIPLVPHFLSQIVLSSADRIMIKNMVDSSAAGIYGLAYSLASIMTLFTTAISQTISPWMYRRIKNKDFGEIENLSYIALELIAILNIILMLVAPEAIAIFAPDSYSDAVWIIPPVAMSTFFMLSYDLFARFAFYQAKTKLIMGASVIIAALNVLLNYIFIKTFGYIAAGYTTLFCYILYSIIHYCLMKYICKKYYNDAKVYNFRKFILLSMAFICVGVIITVSYQNAYTRYALIIFILIMSLVKRKRLVSQIKEIMSVRQNNRGKINAESEECF